MSETKPIFRSVRAVLKNTTNELKKEFKTSQCLLLVSVGQEAHEGERFAATIGLINDSFGACIISLYDSLQRYTMALNSTKGPDNFYDLAVKEGDLWLERNEKYYSRLAIPMKITRWDTWLHHPNYLTQQNKLKTLIDQDVTYKVTLDNTIRNYLDKYISRLSDPAKFDYSRAQLVCFNYILEECTVLCLWSELRCKFEIYPNRHNDAMEETRKRFVLPETLDVMRPIQLGFRNTGQMKPQHFHVLYQEKSSNGVKNVFNL